MSRRAISTTRVGVTVKETAKGVGRDGVVLQRRGREE